MTEPRTTKAMRKTPAIWTTVATLVALIGGPLAMPAAAIECYPQQASGPNLATFLQERIDNLPEPDPQAALQGDLDPSLQAVQQLIAEVNECLETSGADTIAPNLIDSGSYLLNSYGKIINVILCNGMVYYRVLHAEGTSTASYVNLYYNGIGGFRMAYNIGQPQISVSEMGYTAILTSNAQGDDHNPVNNHVDYVTMENTTTGDVCGHDFGTMDGDAYDFTVQAGAVRIVQTVATECAVSFGLALRNSLFVWKVTDAVGITSEIGIEGRANVKCWEEVTVTTEGTKIIQFNTPLTLLPEADTFICSEGVTILASGDNCYGPTTTQDM